MSRFIECLQLVPLCYLFAYLPLTHISPVSIVTVSTMAKRESANRFMLSMSVIIEQNEIKTDVRHVIIGNGKGEAFIVHGSLSRTFDGTTFLDDTLVLVEHVDFKIRI